MSRKLGVRGALWTGKCGYRTMGEVTWCGDAIDYVGPVRSEAETADVTMLTGAEAGVFCMPAFQDAHVHVIFGGSQLCNCVLESTGTLANGLKTIREFASSNCLTSDCEWVIGSGWVDDWFSHCNESPRAMLDAVVPSRPAVIRRWDGHAAWANTRALQIAKITEDTHITGGVVCLDSNGIPNGLLHEEASEFLYKCLPPPTHAFKMAALATGLSQLRPLGITAFQEGLVRDSNFPYYADMFLTEPTVTNNEPCSEREPSDRISTICKPCGVHYRLPDRYLLPKASLSLQWVKGVTTVEHLNSLRASQRTHFRVSTVKIMLDGVMESRTAALHQPFLLETCPNPMGLLNYDPKELEDIIVQLDGNGYQIHIHAVGDRAVTVALDGFEVARRKHGMNDLRHHIAHLQLVCPSDIPRFARLGIISTFSPLWFRLDNDMKTTQTVLGPLRSSQQYPIRSILESGGKLCCGSDWPVSSLNPLDGIEIAVTHRNIGDDETKPVWLPSQIVPLEDILCAYTSGSAYVNHLDMETGTLEPGKKADLIVLSKDLFQIPLTSIHTAKVLLCVSNGRVVYP
ncbi:amidohydrolase family protein [Pelomyxa schiedti]|nr:amidohydrolase family protein [Pelomyxa schiedti]